MNCVEKLYISSTFIDQCISSNQKLFSFFSKNYKEIFINRSEEIRTKVNNQNDEDEISERSDRKRKPEFKGLCLEEISELNEDSLSYEDVSFLLNKERDKKLLKRNESLKKKIEKRKINKHEMDKDFLCNEQLNENFLNEQMNERFCNRDLIKRMKKVHDGWKISETLIRKISCESKMTENSVIDKELSEKVINKITGTIINDTFNNTTEKTFEDTTEEEFDKEYGNVVDKTTVKIFDVVTGEIIGEIEDIFNQISKEPNKVRKKSVDNCYEKFDEISKNCHETGKQFNDTIGKFDETDDRFYEIDDKFDKSEEKFYKAEIFNEVKEFDEDDRFYEAKEIFDQAERYAETDDELDKAERYTGTDDKLNKAEETVNEDKIFDETIERCERLNKKIDAKAKTYISQSKETANILNKMAESIAATTHENNTKEKIESKNKFQLKRSKRIKKKTFSGKSKKKRNLKEMEKSERKVKSKFLCSQCGKIFHTKYNFDIHYKKHLGENISKCTHCPKKYFNEYYLKMHEKLHEDKNSYKCDICGFCFTNPSNLNRHKKRHFFKKIFKCELCGKEYLDKNNYNAHLFKHVKVKPYFCEICKRRFYAKAALNTHKRVHGHNVV